MARSAPPSSLGPTPPAATPLLGVALQRRRLRPNRSPILAIRDDDWKLLMNPDRSRLELFDMAKDPSELHDLALLHPKIVDRLAARLLA